MEVSWRSTWVDRRFKLNHAGVLNRIIRLDESESRDEQIGYRVKKHRIQQ